MHKVKIFFTYTGTYSEHHNGYEDRRFKYTCGELSDNRIVRSCYWTSYTNWDAAWAVDAGSNKVIAGVKSYHDNGKE